jgi:hypothetical protein
MKIRNLVTATAAVTILLLGGGAAAANASNSVTYASAVTAAYNSANTSNKLSVYDAKSDGYGGRSLYELSNGGTGNLDNDQGFGTTTEKTIGGTGTIKFKACTKNGAATVGCSGQVSSAL